jgi:gentisate 1,2-dioxygenase
MDEVPRRKLTDDLHAAFERAGVRGYWQDRPLAAGPQPRLWRWSEIQPLLLEAARVINLGEETYRRFVRLETHSHYFSVGYQIVLPGEHAAAHRHSASAVRFVTQGSGAYTTSNGEPMPMAPGDLLTQPNWVWHDHTNKTNDVAIWLDCLDSGLIRTLDVFSREAWPHGDAQNLTKPEGYSRQRYGLSRSPADQDWAVPFHYTWEDTQRRLHLMADNNEIDPCDGVLLGYANPITGSYTLRTIACFIQMLMPGMKTRRHRHTGAAIYHVYGGTGVTVVGDKAPTNLEWRDKDAFIVPSWAFHYHQNLSDRPAYLFSVTDRPIIEAAGCYREEL